MEKSAECFDKIWWWLKGQDIQNFGDGLAPIIIENIFYPQPLVFGDTYQIIGSCIEENAINNMDNETDNVQNPIHIYWSCGARENIKPSAATLNKANILSVRGALTRNLLGLPEDTPLGDTGFLFPSFYKPKKRKKYMGKKICIPHISDTLDLEDIKNRTGADIVISPLVKTGTGGIYEIIDAIYSSRFLLAGAMHSVVIAAAYGKSFCALDTGYIDLPFKWRDLYDSMNIPLAFARHISEGIKIYNVFYKGNYIIPNMLGMLEKSPFLIKSDIIEYYKARLENN